MIRLRDTKGEELQPKEVVRFVEICDIDGNVAIAIYRDDNGLIHVIKAGEDHLETKRYAHSMGVKFTEVINLPAPEEAGFVYSK